MQDEKFGKALLLGIKKIPERYSFATEFEGDRYIIESFDQPYVVRQTHLNDSQWEIELPYGIKLPLNLSSLSVDEWDRFHGRTKDMIPFVFSRKAQNELFNLVDEFDDDGITSHGQYYKINPYYTSNADVSDSAFWTNIYQDSSQKPGWDLEGPSPILKDIIPQLKIPKSRVLVVGCGKGHDAYELSQRGNVVTAVDFSEEAIEQAKKLYPPNDNLKYLHADIFDLPDKYLNYFDLVFEHTLFCAIDPTRRQELVSVYRSVLADHGHLLGIFFTIDNLSGPPYGGTEWEYRERLKKKFQFLYWTKWKAQTTRTAGTELIIYAKKL